jgi:hypothetical protein
VTCIHVLSGPNSGGSLDTDAREVTIGSDPSLCDLVLLDPSVSPRHLSVHIDEDGFTEIRPINSALVYVETAGLLQSSIRLQGAVFLKAGDIELLIRPRGFDRVPASEPVAQGDGGNKDTEQPRVTPLRALMIGCCVLGCLVLFWELLSVMSTPAIADSRRTPESTRETVPGDTQRPPHFAGPDRQTESGPSLRANERGGSVLLETPVAPKPAAVPAPTQRTFARMVDGPAGPYLETNQGDKFPLSASESEGYTIHWRSDNEIVLRREGQSVLVKIE